MIKIKHLGLLAIASSTFLFSGCIYVEDTFPEQNGYYNDSPRVNISLISYSYPYYYDRPFYYLGGRYYYGGFFRDGFYHYGNRRFRHGHYYSRGYRYYNGRRFRAENGRYGYYRNRDYYQRRHHYRKIHRERDRRIDRGREYRYREHVGTFDRGDRYYKKSKKEHRKLLKKHVRSALKKEHRNLNYVDKGVVRERRER